MSKKPSRSATQPENYGFPIRLKRSPKSPGGFRIVSGCRDFTLPEAREHWRARARIAKTSCDYDDGNGYCEMCDGPRVRGRKMVRLLPLLAQRAKRYGWKEAK